MDNLSKQTTRLYWDATKKYWYILTGLIVLRPLYITSTYLANVYLTGIALDRLASGGPYDLWSDFGWIIAGLIGFGAIAIVFEFFSVKLIWTLVTKVRNDLAQDCFNRLVSESASFHANRFSGSMVSQTNKFVNSYQTLIDTLHWQIYALFIFIMMAIIVLLPRIPLYTILLLAILTIYFVISIVANRRARGLNSAVADAENSTTGQLADSLSNAMVVKSYSSEEYESSRYADQLEEIKTRSFTLRDYALRKDFILNIPITSATILAVIFSIVAANNGIAPLSTLLIATALSRDLFMRMREFNVNSLRNIAKAYGDAHEMTEILISKPTITDDLKLKKMKLHDESIIFNKVKFQYNENEKTQLFSDFNLVIKPHEKIGLVGPSGGGKTTITKLLLRFMDIQEGSITIGGENISEVSQASLRKQISYVPQEPLLFHRSIADNIRYGNQAATIEEIMQASKLAQAHTFVEGLEDGYETLVGERGVKLSGGQKQRIAIARAILRDAPILILDEATSALDSESEQLIQEALNTLMKNKTSIVIAHRLSTIQKMDRIIVLDDGKIVEEGSHSSLVKKKNGLYARLWSHQSGGFIQD